MTLFNSGLVRRKILQFKELRNPDTGDPSEFSSQQNEDYRSGQLTTILLATLFLHRTAIQDALQRLITRPIEHSNTKLLLSSIAEERIGHINRFAGRNEWLNALQDYVDQAKSGADGKYVVVEATKKAASMLTFSV